MRNIWIQGARPRTLPAAIAPVVVATALSHRLYSINWINALLSLLVGLAMQIGVNYSNDYSDGIKGTDSNRVGPMRLVGSGAASAEQVKRAAILTYLAGAIFGLILALRTSLLLTIIGAIAILAAWTYTGSSKPYGYRGFGEVSVFIFFGVVATNGTFFAVSGHNSGWAFLLSLTMGSLACAILAVNNLRDLPKDLLAGKRTLAVLMGDIKARFLLNGFLLLAHFTCIILTALTPWALLTLLLVPQTRAITKKINRGAHGVDLIPLLGATGKLQMLLSTTLALALLI